MIACPCTDASENSSRRGADCCHQHSALVQKVSCCDYSVCDFAQYLTCRTVSEHCAIVTINDTLDKRLGRQLVNLILKNEVCK